VCIYQVVSEFLDTVSVEIPHHHHHNFKKWLQLARVCLEECGRVAGWGCREGEVAPTALSTEPPRLP
jgi:hypothetical protein